MARDLSRGTASKQAQDAPDDLGGESLPPRDEHIGNRLRCRFQGQGFPPRRSCSHLPACYPPLQSAPRARIPPHQPFLSGRWTHLTFIKAPGRRERRNSPSTHWRQRVYIRPFARSLPRSSLYPFSPSPTPLTDNPSLSLARYASSRPVIAALPPRGMRADVLRRGGRVACGSLAYFAPPFVERIAPFLTRPT